MSDAPGGPGWWQASDGKWYPPTASPGLPPPPAPATSQPAPAKKSGCGAMIGIAVLVLVGAAILGGIVGRNKDSNDPDGSAQLACRHFRNVAADYSAGLLTLVELRDKLKEVNDDAQYSEEPGIATAARQMLASITSGDIEGLTTNVAAMGSACDRAGI